MKIISDELQDQERIDEESLEVEVDGLTQKLIITCSSWRSKSKDWLVLLNDRE